MIDYRFVLCSRCKLPKDNSPEERLVPVNVGKGYIGSVCADCTVIIEKLVKNELNSIPIPEELLKYIKPDC